MKKTLIVFTNARMGGIQKALISYLKQNQDKEEITLRLFYKEGVLLKDIPSTIRVQEVQSDYRYLGMAQADCKTLKDKIKRGIYTVIARVVGQGYAIKLMSLTNRNNDKEEFDEAISFIHVTYFHSLYGGVPQYVLSLKNIKKKICYVHCDYLNSGTRNKYSDCVYKRFDEIVCVSNSTKQLFLQAIPEMTGKVIAKYNPINYSEINKMALIDTYEYDNHYINCITVARLSKEKGIFRVIEALKKIGSNRIRYYIIGEGIWRQKIEETIQEYSLYDNVILLGEQDNPYRYMKNADLLIVSSYHEAAPVVFQEAIALGVPILSTETSSAKEMVGERYGIVVSNNDAAIEDALRKISQNPEILKKFIHREEKDSE